MLLRFVVISVFVVVGRLQMVVGCSMVLRSGLVMVLSRRMLFRVGHRVLLLGNKRLGEGTPNRGAILSNSGAGCSSILPKQEKIRKRGMDRGQNFERCRDRHK